MLFYLRIISFVIAALGFLNPAWGDNFVFDLDLVLFHTNEKATLKFMNIFNAIDGMITFKERPSKFKNHIQMKFADVLNNVSSLNDQTCGTENLAFDENGNAYAPIMCAWLDGTMSNEEIRTLILASIEANPDWFGAKVEQKIICNLVNMVFTPEHFIKTRKLYRDSFKMLKQLKEEGHNIYVLSNWDAESFNLLKSKYPDLFKYIDGAMVSGEANSLKPSPTIFQKLLTHFALDPEKTWFIDNRQDNIDTACSLKIQGIQCVRKGHKKHPNTTQIRAQIAAGQKQ